MPVNSNYSSLGDVSISAVMGFRLNFPKILKSWPCPANSADTFWLKTLSGYIKNYLHLLTLHIDLVLLWKIANNHFFCNMPSVNSITSVVNSMSLLIYYFCFKIVRSTCSEITVFQSAMPQFFLSLCRGWSTSYSCGKIYLHTLSSHPREHVSTVDAGVTLL